MTGSIKMRFVGFASKTEMSQHPAGNETNNNNHSVVRQTDTFRIDIMNCGIKKKPNANMATIVRNQVIRYIREQWTQVNQKLLLEY